MYAQLGTIIFQQLMGFEGFESSYGQEYARHALIEGKPRLQRVGSKLDEHNVSIRLHEAFCDPEAQIEQIKAVCDAGEILPFITGAGSLLGSFVIENLSVSRKETDGEGRITDATISLSLVEHVAPDPLGAKRKTAKAAAFATSGKQPQYIEPLTMQPARLAPAAFMAEANVSKVEIANVTASLATASTNPAKKASLMERAAQSLSKFDLSVSKMQKVLEESSNAQLESQILRDQVARLKTAGSAVRTLVKAGSLSDAIHANNELQAQMRIFSNMSAPVAALTAQRSV